MEEIKQLKRIAEELAKMNKQFETLIRQLQKANKELSEPTPLIGSEGEPKQSDK